MKIAINLTREYIGGITSSNINLINHLYGQDYDLLGIELNARMYMKGPIIFRNFAPEVFDHHIINVHDLPIMDVLKKSKTLKDVERRYKESISIMRCILKKEKPDVVLLSGSHYAPWLMSVAAKREKIPIVLWYSGVLSMETGHYSKKVRNIFQAMEKSLVARAFRIVFPSKLCKDLVETTVTKKKIKKSHIIPNPIANIFTDPCAVEYSNERKIAAVGRYSKIKNFDRFFELHRVLLQRGWNHTASFVTNPESNFNNKPKTIEIVPPTNWEGLKKFYLSQGLIICPSDFETFGNVPMEAACLGIPVLVSDKMGCAEILKKVGLLNMVISFSDIEKVANRVQELCGQSIEPKQLNALKRVLDYRSVSESIREVLQSACRRVCVKKVPILEK
ncbi:MAG: glycosyltransferase family 4 protein [bacterium]|nr:glycosyltransferase family 4 protein [bacterium]